MPDAPSTPPAPLRRLGAVVVGVFATWQLVYLPAANLIHFVPLRARPDAPHPGAASFQREGEFTAVEPLQRAAERAAGALDFWGEVSGQEQGWSMFAPGTPPYSVFVAVEFQFDDGTTDTVRSPFEPAAGADPPPRPPLLNARTFNREALLACPALTLPPVEVAERYVAPGEVENLRRQYRELPEIVRAGRDRFRAWLAWQATRYAAAHPGRGAPAAVVLKHRFIPTPKPGEPADWSRPAAERPFARWRPAADALEAYDVLGGRFVPAEAGP